MIHGDIKVYGKFKFDVYNKNDSLDYSTEYVSNFITPTGLSYISHFAFSDCFRYISIGTGTAPNSILNFGTTGLEKPILSSGYSYVGGNPISTCVNRRGNQYSSNGCGTEVTSSGVLLSRSWRIPVSNYFLQDYDINECMVSPGAPKVRAYLFGATGLCHCNEQGYVSPSETGITIGGIESFDFYQRYPNICEADKAFARVIQNIPIKESQYLVIKYSLLINPDTGINTFGFKDHRDNPYIGHDNEGRDNWIGSSGIYNLVHYGIKLINNGSVSSTSTPQINSHYQFRVGESYIPVMGSALEPSCPIINRYGAISCDNVIAVANDEAGTLIDTGLYFPYNPQGRSFPSGLLRFTPEFAKNPQTSYSNYYNFRQNSGFNWPHPNSVNVNITSFRNVFPQDIYFGELSNIKDGVSERNIELTGRVRRKILNYQFAEPALPYPFPVRAFVMSYIHSGNDTAYPELDMLFYPKNSSGMFYKEPEIGIRLSSADSNITFPTGFNTHFNPPEISQFNDIVTDHSIPANYRYIFYGEGEETVFNPLVTGVADAGYVLTTRPLNYFINPYYGNQDDISSYFIITDDFSLIKLTGYIVEAEQFTPQISGTTWTGSEAIPSDATSVVFSLVNQSIGIKSGELNSYVYDDIVSLASVSVIGGINLPFKDYRVFFTGHYLGQPIYIVRTALYDSQLQGSFGERLYNLETSSNFSGRANLSIGIPGYTTPTGMAMNRPTFSGGYSYMDENNILLMQFALQWSSPCSSGVVGC